MEQKHIDEIDESFLGEEFIDEEDLSTNAEGSSPKKKAKTSKKISKEAKVVSDKPVDEVKEVEELKVDDVKKDVKEELKQDTKEDTKEEIIITSVKDEPKIEEDKPKLDPWGEEDDGEGFFKDASTWKAITGIVVILLLLSIFTQGFQFSESSDSNGADALSLVQAEEKALNYVNTNLLRPPFLAEVSGSEEVNDLYKVTLSVAGEEVDSYLTKDGLLFFPQGFNMDESLADVLGENPTGADQVNLEGEVDNVAMPEEVVLDDVVADEEPVAEPVDEVMVEPVEEPMAEPVSEPVVSGNTVKETLTAKKWLFAPNKVSVVKGDTVEFKIVPTGLDFTFGIPSLGVSEEVVGETVVTFVANQVGNFEFKCTTCEDWRGMRGTLSVE